MAELLKVEQIGKKFSGLEVLKGVSFDVAEGEVVGLIGPNGAGKTTIFNIISGALKPSAGEVFFAGRRTTGLQPYKISKLGISRTFQIPQPFSQMTVEQNVRVGVSFSREGGGMIPKDSAKLCDMVGLGKKVKQIAGSLTSSEKKRLEVARALSTSPKLLLVDEFAAGLTVAEATWASDMVKSLSQEYGVTIIWTEHVMRVIMRTVQRVLVLQQGELIARGTPSEIVKNERVLKAYFGGKAV